MEVAVLTWQGTFLMLHLWVHAVLAMVYHPELLKSPSGTETPLNQGMNRNIRLSLASSRQICECMVSADLISPAGYVRSTIHVISLASADDLQTSTPFLTQPLYVAA
jgi:hypothetical protein